MFSYFLENGDSGQLTVALEDKCHSHLHSPFLLAFIAEHNIPWYRDTSLANLGQLSWLHSLSTSYPPLAYTLGCAGNKVGKRIGIEAAQALFSDSQNIKVLTTQFQPLIQSPLHGLL